MSLGNWPALRAGFEPATARLTAECSTIELPKNMCLDSGRFFAPTTLVLFILHHAVYGVSRNSCYSFQATITDACIHLRKLMNGIEPITR